MRPMPSHVTHCVTCRLDPPQVCASQLDARERDRPRGGGGLLGGPATPGDEQGSLYRWAPTQAPYLEQEPTRQRGKVRRAAASVGSRYLRHLL